MEVELTFGYQPIEWKVRTRAESWLRSVGTSDRYIADSSSVRVFYYLAKQVVLDVHHAQLLIS